MNSLPLTSSHWGTYRARVGDGRVKGLLAFEQDKDPSPIAQGIIDVQYGPMRIDSPMVRKSWLTGGAGCRSHLRGVDPFVEVSWAQAEQLVAGELNRVRSDYGNASIFGGSYGWASAGRFHHAQSQLHRFLNCIGGQTLYVSRTGFTNELGFEIYTDGAATDHLALWDYLMACGQRYGMEFSSTRALTIRRIEDGILGNTTDMDTTMTPFEAKLLNCLFLIERKILSKGWIAPSQIESINKTVLYFHRSLHYLHSNSK